MNMLRDILGYAFNKQSQMYLEINACSINKNKSRVFNISHKNTLFLDHEIKPRNYQETHHTRYF